MAPTYMLQAPSRLLVSRKRQERSLVLTCS